ncbi:methyltransferase [Marmoricola endophyticus]|uniref:Putative 4-hydroxy-4-methyl-2-oxoglutarate aldolase n=1 Tax=Marmoricola endophyticus TaxID=2040280 RepID=A0A917BJT7_9ACTN|nr:4-carboxy-4-hydroxy-2-oxoadipate aldolase/oxaloacetate decarboxylase [Marmoricola endophyticus]GGF46264.1 methyltransferase [Marmoricola endophyticus]
MSGPPVGTDVVAELGAAGVATVYEAAGRSGLLEEQWQQVTPGRRVAGRACTVLCGPGDNRAVHEALAHVRPGDVLVVTMDEPAPAAVVGDLLATQAVAQGVVGLLIDAAVRDTAELGQMPLTVHARWRNARGATKAHRGAVDVPVVVGGTRVAPGDVVVLDDDGAAVVPSGEAGRVLDAVRARLQKESALRARWAKGELSYDAYGLRAEDEAAPTPEGSPA